MKYLSTYKLFEANITPVDIIQTLKDILLEVDDCEYSIFFSPLDMANNSEYPDICIKMYPLPDHNYTSIDSTLKRMIVYMKPEGYSVLSTSMNPRIKTKNGKLHLKYSLGSDINIRFTKLKM